MSNVEYTSYQDNSINAIYEKFKKHSRLFLADEAGLGKTVTAAGVMDKIYAEEYENDSSKVMYVLYVAPSDFIAQDASRKLVYKSNNKAKIKKYEKVGNNLAFRLSDLLDEKYNLKMEYTKDCLGENRIVVLPVSIEQFGGEAGAEEEKKQIAGFYELNKNNTWNEIIDYYKELEKQRWHDCAKKRIISYLQNKFYCKKSLEDIKEFLSDTSNKYKVCREEFLKAYETEKERLRNACKNSVKLSEEHERLITIFLNNKGTNNSANNLLCLELLSICKKIQELLKKQGEMQSQRESQDELLKEVDELLSKGKKSIENTFENINTLYCKTKGFFEDPKAPKDVINITIKKLNVRCSVVTSSINRREIELYILNELKPRLIIWDEFHQYMDAFLVDAIGEGGKKIKKIKDSAFYRYENELKNTRMNMLFLSATPYDSYIGGKNKNQYTEDSSEDIQNKPLPSFKDFAILSNNTDVFNKCSEYTKNLEDFITNGGKDRYESLKNARKEAQEELRKIMIRHERTQLNGYVKEEFEELFDVNNIYDKEKQQLTDEYKKVFRESWEYYQYIAEDEMMARKLAMHMPYIYSFSTKYGLSKGNKKTISNSKYKSLIYNKESNDALFLSSNPKVFSEQIKKIKNNTLQLHEIIKHSISDDRDLLLWVPPVVKKYDLEEKNSIFLKHKNHSKLLVFAEFVCYQRGIPFLLSEYVDNGLEELQSEISLSDYTEDDMKIFVEKYDEIFKAADGNVTLEGILNKLPEDWTLEKKYAAVGHPEVCVYRLTQDLEKAKKCRDYFTKYFNNKSIKNVLIRWKEKYAKECLDLNETVLKYCCEGNLYSVLEEWMMHEGDDIFNQMGYVLEKTIKINPIRLKNSEDEKKVYDYTYKKECKFSVRLSPDINDDGSSVKKDEKSELVKCFSSPFWPMVMVTGRGAQESMDFHTYCRRIMHFTIPKGAVSVEQREGRINRFDSLMIKSRAANLKKSNESSVKEILERLGKDRSRGDLYPHWMLPDKNKEIKFQRILAFWPYTDEANEWNRDYTMLNTYRSVFGSIESHRKIEARMKEVSGADYKDIIIDLSAEQVKKN